MTAELKRLRHTTEPPSKAVKALLLARGSALVGEPVSLDRLLKRPEISYDDMPSFHLRPALAAGGEPAGGSRVQIEAICGARMRM